MVEWRGENGRGVSGDKNGEAKAMTRVESVQINLYSEEEYNNLSTTRCVYQDGKWTFNGTVSGHLLRLLAEIQTLVVKSSS